MTFPLKNHTESPRFIMGLWEITDLNDNDNTPVERKKAIRIPKDLPRDIRIIDIPDAEKVCNF